jgi:hypothetical protein
VSEKSQDVALETAARREGRAVWSTFLPGCCCAVLEATSEHSTLRLVGLHCALTSGHSTSLSFTECSGFSPPITVILLIFLCLEGLLFFTFTAVMFGTQIHSICSDETVCPDCAVHCVLCAVCETLGQLVPL